MRGVGGFKEGKRKRLKFISRDIVSPEGSKFAKPRVSEAQP